MLGIRKLWLLVATVRTTTLYSQSFDTNTKKRTTCTLSISLAAHKLHINVYFKQSFRAIQGQPHRRELAFHTFTTKEEAELKVVFRELPADTKECDIKEDLEYPRLHAQPIQLLKNRRLMRTPWNPNNSSTEIKFMRNTPTKSRDSSCSVLLLARPTSSGEKSRRKPAKLSPKHTLGRPPDLTALVPDVPRQCLSYTQ